MPPPAALLSITPAGWNKRAGRKRTAAAKPFVQTICFHYNTAFPVLSHNIRLPESVSCNGVKTRFPQKTKFLRSLNEFFR